MTGMIKLDRADLTVRTRPELVDTDKRFAFYSSVHGHAQAQVLVGSEVPRTNAARPPS